MYQKVNSANSLYMIHPIFSKWLKNKLFSYSLNITSKSRFGSCKIWHSNKHQHTHLLPLTRLQFSKKWVISHLHTMTEQSVCFVLIASYKINKRVILNVELCFLFLVFNTVVLIGAVCRLLHCLYSYVFVDLSYFIMCNRFWFG